MFDLDALEAADRKLCARPRDDRDAPREAPDGPVAGPEPAPRGCPHLAALAARGAS